MSAKPLGTSTQGRRVRRSPRRASRAGVFAGAQISGRSRVLETSLNLVCGRWARRRMGATESRRHCDQRGHRLQRPGSNAIDIFTRAHSNRSLPDSEPARGTERTSRRSRAPPCPPSPRLSCRAMPMVLQLYALLRGRSGAVMNNVARPGDRPVQRRSFAWRRSRRQDRTQRSRHLHARPLLSKRLRRLGVHFGPVNGRGPAR